MSIRIITTGQLVSDTSIEVTRRDGNGVAWRLTSGGNLEINYQESPSIVPMILVPSGSGVYSSIVSEQANPQTVFFAQPRGLSRDPSCITPIRPSGLNPCYLTFVGGGRPPTMSDGDVAIGRVQMVNVVTILEATKFGSPPSADQGQGVCQTVGSGTNSWYWFTGPGSSSGQILIDQIDNSLGAEPFQVRGPGTFNTPSMTAWHNGTLSTTYHVIHYFGYAFHSAVGSVIINNSSGALSFPSDYRIKRDIRDLDDGIDLIRRMRPVRFQWSKGLESGVGFLAHELQEVLPRAVTGHRDEVNAHGKPVYQNVDVRKTIPVIASALKAISSELREIKNQISSQGA